MWYGWIPVLKNDKPTRIHGRHPVDTDRFSLHDCNEETLLVNYKAKEGFEEEIKITIVDGFFQMDGLYELDRVRASLVMNNLYLHLKECYHIDITHNRGDGLTTVEADNIDEACVLIADMITENCEDFLPRAEVILDVETLREAYLKSRGSVEYGLFFIDRYKEALGDNYLEFQERLTSNSRFIDMIYGTRRDVIQDDLAYQSKEMSQNTEFLSSVVLAMTIGSIIVSCSAFVYDHQNLGAPTTGLVVSVAIVIPAIIIAHSYSKRKNLLQHRRLRLYRNNTNDV